jgi:predicted enzyme related to lactoylglutathione lyase
MSDREQYPAGVPCFVDTLVPDVEAAKRFYGAVFGWEFTGPGAMPDDPPGQYLSPAFAAATSPRSGRCPRTAATARDPRPAGTPTSR